MCVKACPDNPLYTNGSDVPYTYYADPTTRLCVLACNASGNYFGNNKTKTCETTCLDFQSYAEAQSSYRVCIDRCLSLPSVLYANNFTKKCGTTL